MRNKILIGTFALIFVLVGARAEEQPSPVLTTLSSTTISGFVNRSAQWHVHSSPVRFEDVCQALCTRGLRVKGLGNHYIFFQSGRPVLHLSRRGPFLNRPEIQQARRFLNGSVIP
jgi:hypothetical protein